MGEITGIEWCHHTWSPWEGCAKVSAGCANCYADNLNSRWGKDNWGFAPDGSRKALLERSEAYWKKPHQWNKEAQKAGETRRVFPSMCDPFDEAASPEQFARFGNLILETPNLTWLLLTKRPENVMPRWKQFAGWDGQLPDNVWLGVSVENQAEAQKRIPELVKIPSHVRFLSCEPLLGEVDLFRVLIDWNEDAPNGALDLIDWVIIGGESQHGARRMNPEWADSLIIQCGHFFNVSVFFKQTGEVLAKEFGLKSKTGKDMLELPVQWRVQEFPR